MRQQRQALTRRILKRGVHAPPRVGPVVHLLGEGARECLESDTGFALTQRARPLGHQIASVLCGLHRPRCASKCVALRLRWKRHAEERDAPDYRGQREGQLHRHERAALIAEEIDLSEAHGGAEVRDRGRIVLDRRSCGWRIGAAEARQIGCVNRAVTAHRAQQLLEHSTRHRTVVHADERCRLVETAAGRNGVVNVQLSEAAFEIAAPDARLRIADATRDGTPRHAKPPTGMLPLSPTAEADRNSSRKVWSSTWHVRSGAVKLRPQRDAITEMTHGTTAGNRRRPGGTEWMRAG